jgi:hypothetical protein
MPNEGWDLMNESEGEDELGLHGWSICICSRTQAYLCAIETMTAPLVDHDIRRLAPLTQYGVLGNIISIE